MASFLEFRGLRRLVIDGFLIIFMIISLEMGVRVGRRRLCIDNSSTPFPFPSCIYVVDGRYEYGRTNHQRRNED